MERIKYWTAELHCHIGSDAPKNTPQAIASKVRELAAKEKVNAVWFLDHDIFPDKSFFEKLEPLPVPVMPGIEVSSSFGPTRLVHIGGLFPKIPDYWPFAKPDWSGGLQSRINTVAALPHPKDVIEAILESGGLPILFHPSNLIPWTSLRLSEIRKLAEDIDLKLVPLELNSSCIYAPSHQSVIELAKELGGLALVGGSDAHDPPLIGQKRTLFPRYNDNPFSDLRQAVNNRETIVVGNNQTFFQWLTLMGQRIDLNPTFTKLLRSYYFKKPEKNEADKIKKNYLENR